MRAGGPGSLRLWPARLLQRIGWSALRAPGYRLLLVGQALASTGSWLYFAVLGSYVFELTRSGSDVALVYAVATAPSLLLTLHAGALTDRVGPRLILVASLLATALVTAGLGIVATHGEPPLWPFVVLAFAIGTLTTIGGPASFAIIGQLVRPSQVSSGVALTFVQLNLARVSGGAAMTVALALGSHSGAFLVAAAMIAAGLIPLFRLPAVELPHDTKRRSRSVIAAVLAAIRFARRSRPRLVLVALAPLPGAFGLLYLLLLPGIANDLGLGPNGVGTLLVASGIGGLIGSLAAERLMRWLTHGTALVVALAAAGLALIGIGGVNDSTIALVLFAVVGAGFVVYPSASLALLQSMTPARMHGRLASLYSLMFWGLLPIGGFVSGPLIAALGARPTLIACGTIVITVLVGAVMLYPALARMRLTAAGGVDTG